MSSDPMPIPIDVPNPENPALDQASLPAEVREAGPAELPSHPVAAVPLQEYQSTEEAVDVVPAQPKTSEPVVKNNLIGATAFETDQAKQRALTPGKAWFGERDYSEMECRLVTGIQTSEEEMMEFLIKTDEAHGVPSGHFKLHANPKHNILADAGRAVIILTTTTQAPKVESILMNAIREDILKTLSEDPAKELLFTCHSEGGAAVVSAIDSINREYYSAAQKELKRNRLLDELAADKENPPKKLTQAYRAVTRFRGEVVTQGEEKSYKAQGELKWWLKNRKRLHVDTYAIGIASVVEKMEENFNVYADWRDPVAVTTLAIHGIPTTVTDWTSGVKNYNYPQYHCLWSDLSLADFKNPVAAHQYTKLLEARKKYEIEKKEAAEKAKETKEEEAKTELDPIKEAHNETPSKENRFGMVLRSVRDTITRPFRSRKSEEITSKD